MSELPREPGRQASDSDLVDSGLSTEERQLRAAFASTGSRPRPKPSWERDVWRRVLRDEAPAPGAPRLQRFAVAAVSVMCVVVAVMGWKLWTLGEELEHHRSAARQLLLDGERAERARAAAEGRLAQMLASAEAERSRLERELSEAKDPAKEEALRREILAKQEKIRQLYETNRARRAADRKMRSGTRNIKCDPNDPLCGL